MSIKTKSGKNVAEVMLKIGDFPMVKERCLFKEALEEMGKFNLGMVCIVGSENQLLGVVTDGDIRRKLLKVQKPFSAFFVDDALDHAIKSPATILSDSSLEAGVDLMEVKQVWDLPVIDSSNHLVGVLHLHPALQAVLDSI